MIVKEYGDGVLICPECGSDDVDLRTGGVRCFCWQCGRSGDVEIFEREEEASK